MWPYFWIGHSVIHLIICPQCVIHIFVVFYILWILFCVMWKFWSGFCFSSVTYCHFCWDTQRKAVPITSLKQFHARTSSLRCRPCSSHHRRIILLRLKKWWGAQQAQWNPPRNWNHNQTIHHPTTGIQICLHLYLMNTSWMTTSILIVYTHHWVSLIKSGTMTGHPYWMMCVM